MFSDKIWPFFDTYVHLPNFDVASDSFATLKDILTRHRAVAAEFLEKEYDHVSLSFSSLIPCVCVWESVLVCAVTPSHRCSLTLARILTPPKPRTHTHARTCLQVFAKYKTLLSSDNYVTKRMSLKMLGEILLDRSNFNVM